MLKREVVKPRSFWLETIAAAVAFCALSYASGCDFGGPIEADVDLELVECCEAFPDGFGLEDCVKDTLDTFNAWYRYDTDAYGCVPYTCPAGGTVRWSTRACP